VVILSEISKAQGGFKRDKRRKWDKFPHKGIEFRKRKNLKGIEQNEVL
jgi:hypothetical protein